MKIINFRFVKDDDRASQFLPGNSLVHFSRVGGKFYLGEKKMIPSNREKSFTRRRK